MDIIQLHNEMKNCKDCRLCDSRVQVVTYRGNPTAKIMFIGEAPGPDEDKDGKPFIGRAGHLLDKWISTLGIGSEEFFITNTVKCYPNINGAIRAPDTDEQLACQHWLEKQIELMNPSYIVTLGKVAMQYFFPDKEKIMSEAGNCYIVNNRKVFIFAHPSYYLRNPYMPWREMLSGFYKELHNGEEIPKDKPSKLVYDLETSSVDPVSGKIRRYGFYSYRDEKTYILYPKDIRQVEHLLTTHDTLIGFNNHDFDDEFLTAKKIRFTPTHNLDLKVIVEKRQGVMKEQFDKFSLDFICMTLGLGRKMETPVALFAKEPEECTPEENKVIDDYLTQDIILTKALYEKLDNQFAPLLEFLNPADRIKHGHLTFATSVYAYKVICKLADLEEKYNQIQISEEEEESYQGAFVLIPSIEKVVWKEGKEIIRCFDFKSAYPHAYMMQNLYNKAKPEDIAIGKYYSGNTLYQLQGKYNNQEMGKIEKVIQMLYKLRMQYKKNKDPREYAIKIILNIMYGVSGNPVFGSCFDIDTASDCTKTVREWIGFAKNRFEEKGYKVLYQDTDSCFIHDPFNDLDKITSVKDNIISIIKSQVPFPQDTFDMGKENDIKAIFFFKKKDGTFEKKNYMYIDIDNTLTVKGLPIKKLTAAPLSRNVFATIKPQIIESLDCKFDKSYIESLIKAKVAKDGIIVATRMFRIFPGKVYKNDNAIQAQISERYGFGAHNLIKNKRIGVGKGVKYCSIEEATQAELKYEDLDLDNVWSELHPFIKEVKMMTLARWNK